MKIIGITGGVGSGKSALLAAIQEEFRCRVLVADEIAHFLKEPGQSCYKPLIKLLGEQILDKKGFIDKKKMADAIFGDNRLLKEVNKIIHPAVKQYILQCIEEERQRGLSDFVFVEAALFIEAGYRDMVDSLWYIYACVEARIRRLMEGRGYTLDKIYSIMDKQLKEEAFRSAADVVIDNSSSLEDAMQEVRAELTKA